MPITVQWLDDSQRIIFWTITDPWTLDELHLANKQGNDMIRTVDHQVCAVIDTLGVTIPRTLFTSLNTLDRIAAPNFDTNAIVTHSPVVRAMLNMYRRLPNAKLSFKLFDNLDDALAFVRERQAAAPDAD